MNAVEYISAKAVQLFNATAFAEMTAGNVIMILIGAGFHLPGDHETLRAATARADWIRNHRGQHPGGGRNGIERL